MIKYILIAILHLAFLKTSIAQILCIYCYDQNPSISSGVNNLLLNGGFENGCPNAGRFCSTDVLNTCSITNWVCTGGTSTYAHMVDSSYSMVPEGILAAYLGNYMCKGVCSPVDYDTSCFINSGCVVTGIPAGYPVNDPQFAGASGVILEQTVSGLTTGNTYVLEFWAGGENNSFESGLFAVDIGFGNTFFRDKPTNPYWSGDIGTRFIIEFIATSVSHTIKFINWGHICEFCTELVIDDARLYTLAELSPLVPHCTSEINELSKNVDVIVFPNPIQDILNITNNNGEPSEIILYDMASKKIMQQNFTKSISLNTEKLGKGMYFYEVRSKRGAFRKGKFVKN